jgi:hypothetical protein
MFLCGLGALGAKTELPEFSLTLNETKQNGAF